MKKSTSLVVRRYGPQGINTSRRVIFEATPGFGEVECWARLLSLSDDMHDLAHEELAKIVGFGGNRDMEISRDSPLTQLLTDCPAELLFHFKEKGNNAYEYKAQAEQERKPCMSR